jgi:hypothetical protein
VHVCLRLKAAWCAVMDGCAARRHAAASGSEKVMLQEHVLVRGRHVAVGGQLRGSHSQQAIWRPAGDGSMQSECRRA